MLRTPLLDGPSYAELEPGHPLYMVAALVYHHGHELSRDVRRGLLVGLEAAWPRTRGDRKDRDHRALVAWHAHRDGASIDQVAALFCVEPETAQRWVRRVDRELDPAQFPIGPEPPADFKPKPGVELPAGFVPGAGTPSAGEQWRVEVASDRDAEPGDPAGMLAYMQALAPDAAQAARQLDERQRAIDAGARLPGPMTRIEAESKAPAALTRWCAACSGMASEGHFEANPTHARRSGRAA